MCVRTKIICTMGPSVASLEKIEALLHAGMNVARLNFSHGTHAEHAQMIALLKEARKKTQKPLAILLDMQGPKVRVGQIQGGSLSLVSDQIIHLVPNGKGGADSIPFHPVAIMQAMKPQMKILFDDGYIAATILEVHPDSVKLKVCNAGELKTGKGISVPGASLPLPALTEQDQKDLEFGCKHDVDWIAASFVRSAQQVKVIQEAIVKASSSYIPLFAKIENKEGIDHFDEIVAQADGILIARGDLGVEVDLATVPRLQKRMIRKCYEMGKPVITATHMMESMILYPRPTRAEVSDVANAVYDFSSAIMLSAETAVGKYPIETVSLMQQIAKETEEDIDYQIREMTQGSIETCLELAVVNTAQRIKAKAIFSLAASKSTSRLAAKWRSHIPVIGVAFCEKEYHQLGASWGVIPVLSEGKKTTKELFALVQEYALKNQLVALGDLVVVMIDEGFHHSTSLNTMMIETVRR